ncbi:polysaccharide pyruvyl transferase family protein [Bradyrhizobium sp. WSM1417]|uniref:polysaccharide pyruvyl transferase family protein n=1 Tax=Bradyrhizobium sp. WSM1417 TaxID=754500 RepID=UPI000A01DB33|nr:polysaccharide pyruvyl transferase family protein [Bradyrhizobium sp. WSM1417]
MKLSICGSFGFGNVGDEAIPLAIADLGLSLGVLIEPIVIGRYDEPALAEVIGWSNRDKERRETLRGVPLVFSGGGIIDSTPNAVLFRCSKLLERGYASKASVFGASVEAGVSYDWRCRWRLKRLLRSIGVVYTRDDLSNRMLKLILPQIEVKTIGDLVLWLKPKFDEKICLPTRYIAVNLAQRWSGDPAWQQWIVVELASLSKLLNLGIVFVPMTGEYDDDRIEHRLIAEKLRLVAPEIEVQCLEETLNPRLVAGIFAKAELAVSMRLHGCVIAFAQETACVGIGYHPKLFGFFETVNLTGAIIPTSPPAIQTKGIYGYSFADLGVKDGDLVRAAQDSLSEIDFSMLSVLKERSAAAFLDILGLAKSTATSTRNVLRV